MSDTDLAIYVLDVGQGDCTFIIPPSGEGDPIMFDCNDAYVAERFVANHAINRLTAVIASHLDRDHIRGIVPFLLGHFRAGRAIGQLVVGVDRPPLASERSEVAILLKQALEWDAAPPCPGFALADPTRAGAAPLVIASGNQWSVELVLPFYAERLRVGTGRQDPNMCSAVLRVSRAGTSVLIGGDAPLASWERLEAQYVPARAIRLPHHAGRLEPNGDRWTQFSDLYNAIGASHALVSAGTNNNNGHPLPEHLIAARLPGRSCRVRCTQLTERCHHRPATLRKDALRTAAAVEWPYRHHVKPGDPARRSTDETPCAGSMALLLTQQGSIDVLPAAGGPHDAFIGKTSRPQCRS